MNTTRILLPLAVGTALALGVGCGKKEQSEGMPAGSAKKSAPAQEATRVEAAMVDVSVGSIKIVRPGEIKGAREATLASALGGFVERVLVETGTSVKKNQVIAYVDSSTHGAQAKLTRVEVDEAQRELARVERLGKAIATARVDAARSRVARAKAQHSLSVTRQGRSAIRAPFAGVLVGLNIERGEVLAPGAPIARLIQLDPLRVAVSVTDRDVVALKEGGDAYVTTAAVVDPVHGKVAQIEKAANMKTRTFMVEVEVANVDQRLLPGMIAQVTFSSARGGEAIYLPQDLLVTQLDGNGVFVIEDNVARWRPVKLGSIIGTDVEITSGLEAGETIVTLGHRALAEGDPLIVTRSGRCCTSGRIVFEDPSEQTKGATKSEMETKASDKSAATSKKDDKKDDKK